jgi:predicted GIY-YIG superfamily endonuclease
MDLYIYILELEEGKYYVGQTTNPTRRIQQHLDGSGSKWTERYRPVRTLDIIKTDDPFDEDKWVKRMMLKYKVSNVRGGSYSQLVLEKEAKLALRKEIRNATNKCYYCGGDHFIGQCEEKDDGDVVDTETDNEYVHIPNIIDRYPDISYRTSIYDYSPLEVAVTKINQWLIGVSIGKLKHGCIYDYGLDMCDMETLEHLCDNKDRLVMLFSQDHIPKMSQSKVPNKDGKEKAMTKFRLMIANDRTDIQKFVVDIADYHSLFDIHRVVKVTDKLMAKFVSLVLSVDHVNMTDYNKYMEFKRFSSL